MSVRKLILLILAVLLAFTAWDAIGWYASPQSVDNTQAGNIHTLKGSSITDTEGLGTFQSVVYWLDAPLPKDTSVVLTYTKEDFSSGRIERRFLRDTRQIAFQVPLGKYINLDCYVDANVGIEKVTISDQSSDAHFPYPFRAANVLIPSAILLAVLLLFIYVKPLNILIKLIDRKILDPETRYKGVTVVYIIFAVVALIHHIYVTMYHKYVLTGSTDLGIPLLVFAGITFFFGKLWKDKIAWILLALLVLKYARTALLGQDILTETGYIYTMSIYAFFGCYGVSHALDRKYWRCFFTALCAIWTLAVLFYAIIGIRVAVTGVPIKNFGSEYFKINPEHRLYFIYHPVTSGIILSISSFIALFGCFVTKQKFLRLLYIPAALVFYFAGSLTGTRTAFLMSGLLVALLLYLFLRDKLKPGQPKRFALTAGKYILMCAVCLAVAAAVTFLQSKSVNFVKVLQGQGGLISTALAEGSSLGTEVTQRDLQLSLDLDYMLNGRFVLWKSILKMVVSNPRNLLLGQSVYEPMTLINEIRVPQGLEYLYHCHNSLLQNLMENGIPALLLYVAFLCASVFHAARIFRNKDLPFWQRMIPIGIILCIIEGLLDNTCHVTYGYPQMTVLYLLSGFTITIGRRAKKGNLTD